MVCRHRRKQVNPATTTRHLPPLSAAPRSASLVPRSATTLGKTTTTWNHLQFSTKPPFRYGEPIKKNLPEWLSYIKPLDNSFSGLLYNQFNNNPVGDFFKEKNILNHELYGTFSISDTLGYADSPFDRPSFFLLHPHSPLK